MTVSSSGTYEGHIPNHSKDKLGECEDEDVNSNVNGSIEFNSPSVTIKDYRETKWTRQF